ncbi:GNAT family N-acetyltransferase [Massilia sp. S19_KUP03_FR1]|uniref:GNAT family N-acetyltransferase n=1 Tax=Massilia sp. S19_KUP03_FR1 TaxID=3025503 RepID=UPI002FCDA11F
MSAPCDLDLLQRWLTGWSRSRGLPLPRHEGGGQRVDVDWPDQQRRHVFADAGAALRACADAIHDPFIYVKAAVDCATLRAALPERWSIEEQRYLMTHSGPMQSAAALPADYTTLLTVEHAAYVIDVIDGAGAVAASGRVTLNAGTAVFDRISTDAAHRRLGLATAVMLSLDRLATQAASTERLLVATEMGAALYTHLGWRILAPFATAFLPQ